MITDVRLRQVIANGLRSPLREVGPPDDPEAVVFVHGNPGSSEDWTDLLGALGGSTRAVAVDMPGFGQADKPSSFDYTVAGYARHLAALLDVLGVGRAHLVLHDFGGPWGLQWAAEHAEAFASAVLINTGVLPGYRWHYLARVWRTPLLGEAAMATTTRAGTGLLLRHGNPRGLPEPALDRMHRDFDRATRRAVLRLYRAESHPDRLARAQSDALRPLDRPALVVWGRHDPYLPVTLAARQRDAFPRAEVHVLDGSGHWPFLDDPEGTRALVVPFLRAVTAAG